MSVKTLRELFGEPDGWQNLMSDGEDGTMPDLIGATILDIFISGTQVAIYIRTTEGVEALAVFHVEDHKVRGRIANVMQPGLSVHEALAFPI
jgi:hypothetical protein